jgi:hypothetical protein
MIPLLEALENTITPKLISQMSERLNIGTGTADQGWRIALPLLATALTRLLDSPNGTTLVGKLIDAGDSNIVGNLMDTIYNIPLEEGGHLLRQLLGDGTPAVLTTLEKKTGADLGPLLAIIGPIVMGYLNGVVERDKLDMTGLATQLTTQVAQYNQAGNPALATVNEAFYVVDAQHERKAHFNADELNMLQRAPIAAAVLVIAAAPSNPLGRAKETSALNLALIETARTETATSLVAALFGDGVNMAALDELMKTRSALEVAEVRRGYLTTCSAAVQLIVSKGLETDVAPYKQLIVRVAEKVAQAAHEGGFLGIGGVAISVEERQVINELAQTLGLNPSNVS